MSSPVSPSPTGTDTPLIRQYLQIKAEHPDYVLFFRCGDFYEMFFEDARIAAETLGITLTARGTDSKGQPIPLSGIPYHAVDQYLARMIRAGFRVAMCEQVEDPKTAKGVVRREVTRLITPGTILEDHLLDSRTPNYTVALDLSDGIYGLAAAEFSTGDFVAYEFSGKRALSDLRAELTRLGPVEIVIPRSAQDELLRLGVLSGLALEEYAAQGGEGRVTATTALSVVEEGLDSMEEVERQLRQHFSMKDLTAVGLAGHGSACRAVLRLKEYTFRTGGEPSNLMRVRFVERGDTMSLDPITQRSLELVVNLHDGSRRHTLLETLDKTVTPLGARYLRQAILSPLRVVESINHRLDAVEWLRDRHEIRSLLREEIRHVRDLERILTRALLHSTNPRDLQALQMSLSRIPGIQGLLRQAGELPKLLLGCADQLDPLEELVRRLREALVDEPPASARDGNLIRSGFDPKLDELRSISTDSKSWIAEMRNREAARTGINSLKVGYNRVFGYYLEVTNSHKGKVPADWTRKQTLSTGERYVTPELKEKEEIILHAEERVLELEYEWFVRLYSALPEVADRIRGNAHALAQLDCLASLAEVASVRGYMRPHFEPLPDAIDAVASIPAGDSGAKARPKKIPLPSHRLVIREGRHPVLDALRLEQPFVPNDTYLSHEDSQVLLITGPNMAGKSTYIRQVALLTLMAHMGSLVPAAECHLTPVDRIFTRVGAMDHLAKGQSTFLVEMSETANILHHATDDSLVILDEIGRGTSTYDGLAIAWAVVEYLHQNPGRRPRTLFATHYHELTELEGLFQRVRNHHVAIAEDGDRITFLYRILRGTSDRSYGIHAAQVAGLPKRAVDRARRILADLEAGRPIHGLEGNGGSGGPSVTVGARHLQLQLFDSATDPVRQRLAEMNIHTMTPLQALSALAELITEAKKS